MLRIRPLTSYSLPAERRRTAGRREPGAIAFPVPSRSAVTIEDLGGGMANVSINQTIPKSLAQAITQMLRDNPVCSVVGAVPVSGS